MNKRLIPSQRRAIKHLADAGVPVKLLAEAFHCGLTTVKHIRRGYWTGGTGVSQIRGVSAPYTPDPTVPWRNA